MISREEAINFLNSTSSKDILDKLAQINNTFKREYITYSKTSLYLYQSGAEISADTASLEKISQV